MRLSEYIKGLVNILAENEDMDVDSIWDDNGSVYIRAEDGNIIREY